MLETLADGLALPRLRPLAFAQAAVAQVGVELGQVLDGRHRRAPFLLSFSDRKGAAFSIVMEPEKWLRAGAACVGET